MRKRKTQLQSQQAFLRQLTVKGMETQELSFDAGENATATLEVSLAVSYQVKHNLTM